MANNWYTYDYKVGDTIRHSGITTDTSRREQEHKLRWPGGRLVVVGGPMSEDAARKWEETKQKTITPQRK